MYESRDQKRLGRMKDTVGDDSRRQSVTEFDVCCPAPCGHVATVTSDARGLSQDTVFCDIPKKARLPLLDMRLLGDDRRGALAFAARPRISHVRGYRQISL